MAAAKDRIQAESLRWSAVVVVEGELDIGQGCDSIGKAK